MLRESKNEVVEEKKADENHVKERILKSAEELFMRYGFKSITMDEIAKHLGVSKKTIYQYFQDKDDIVIQCIENHLSCDQIVIEKLFSTASNPVEEFFIEIRHLKLALSSVHPSIIFELKKYHPKAWVIIQDHKEKFFLKTIIENLKKGIELGLYRPEINPQILAKLRIEQVTMGFDHQLFPDSEFDLKTIQLQLLYHFIYGILTEKGKEILKQLHIQNPDKEI